MKREKNILIIDDDFVNNFLTQRLVSKLDLVQQTKVVTNGQEGLDYITRFCKNDHVCCPDLVLLDIHMPVLNAFEFVKKFYESKDFDKNKIRIIILASFFTDDDIRFFESFGVHDFITKPLTEEKFLQYLEPRAGLNKSFA